MNNRVILFVCKGNSGRSQMAEAFYNSLSQSGKAISAGADPDKEIHPWTIQLMKESGIDISKQKPKPLTNELMEKADQIIIMDSGLIKDIEIAPGIKAKIRVLEAGALLGKPIEKVREIRDEIKEKVERLIRQSDF